MRVLASVLPGTGHLLPLVPTLRALQQAGHEVLVASAEPLRAEVEDVGLAFTGVGPPWHESNPDLHLPGFRAAGALGQLRTFAGLASATLPDLLAINQQVRPDLMMREPYEFGAWLAAERCRLPIVVHAIGVVSGSMLLLAAVAGEQLVAARSAAGLPADPDLRSLYGDGLISFYPPSLQFLPVPPPPVPHQLVRLPPPGPPQLPFDRVQPDWPLVYVTLGTVFNTNVGLLRTLLAGVAALDVEVLVSTGTTVDPAVLGPQPEHVHLARFVPHDQVLAAADLVVCHAGVGTVYGALSVGLPLVVAPLAADQPVCAMGCVHAGVAESLAPVPPPEDFLACVTDPAAVTPAQVTSAVRRVLDGETYRQAARRIAAEIAAIPPPETTLPWLQRIAPDPSE